jgi:dTDP-D-glucose 4,6-dehydratase
MFIETMGHTLSRPSWKFRVEEADKVAKRSVFRLIWPKWIGANALPSHEIANISLEDLCYLIGLYLGDGACSSKDVQEIKTGSGRKDYLVAARDRKGKFCSLPERQPTTKVRFFPRIFLYIPKADKARSKVEEVLTRCGLKWHAEGKVVIYFSSHELFRIFDACGHTSLSKQIPPEFLQLSPRYLSHLLQGLLDSDGDGKVHYRTISEKLMAGVVELCTKLSKSINVKAYEQYENIIQTRVVKGKPFYDISISNGKRFSGSRYVTKRNIEKVEYHGIVWCPTVQDNGNLLVERNGRIAFCGNSEVYGSAHGDYMSETDPLEPASPYAAAKAGADRLVYAYWNTYDIPAVILRPFNNIGSHQHLEKLIPRFITSCILNEPLNIHGDGSASRDWVYVEDTCKAVDAALHCDIKKVKGEVINVGTGRSIDIKTIALMIVQMMGRGKDLIRYIEDRPGQVIRHTSSTDKALKLLNWKAEVKFEDGLERTIAWYKDNQAWWERQMWMRSIPIVTKDGKKVTH